MSEGRCSTCRFWQPWPPTPEPPCAGWCAKLSSGAHREGVRGGRAMAIGARSSEGRFIAQPDFGCVEWLPATSPAPHLVPTEHPL